MHQVGLGEGFAPSAATAVMAKQVPENERSRAVATVFGGLDLGSAVGLLICGPLIRLYGWPCVFYWFALLGLVWCLAWPLMRPKKIDAIMWKGEATEKPASTNGAVSSEEKEQVCHLSDEMSTYPYALHLTCNYYVSIELELDAVKYQKAASIF